MNLKHIQPYNQFLKNLNESEIKRLRIIRAKSYDDMFNLGTPRWLPCRKYGEEYFYKMSELGDFFIVQDLESKPIFLLHPETKLMIDFDNHYFEGDEFYRKLEEYPELLNGLNSIY